MRLLLLCALLCCRGPARPVTARGVVSCGPCQARADGFAQVRVAVLLRDGGAPLRGVRVLFGSSDGAVTDGEGRAAATFSSRSAGTREVQVRLPDGTSVGSVAVEFFAGSFPRVDLGTP